MGVLPGFAAGNKTPCGQNLAEIRSEKLCPILQSQVLLLSALHVFLN